MGQQHEPLVVHVEYREPFDWSALLDFFSARSIDTVETVSADFYRRTLRMNSSDTVAVGWIDIRNDPGRCALRVELGSPLKHVLEHVRSRVTKAFDLDCVPEDVNAVLGDLAAANPGLRLPGAFDFFEVVVRAVIGQQISVKAARTLAGRFAKSYGVPIETPFPELTRVFPRPSTIAKLPPDALTELGIMAARSRSICALAQALTAGTLAPGPGANIELDVDAVKTIPGIGDWTAQYIAMRAWGWRDAFPHTDLGVMKALGTRDRKQVLDIAEAWRPWRSYAVMHLWHRLNSPR